MILLIHVVHRSNVSRTALAWMQWQKSHRKKMSFYFHCSTWFAGHFSWLSHATVISRRKIRTKPPWNLMLKEWYEKKNNIEGAAILLDEVKKFDYTIFVCSKFTWILLPIFVWTRKKVHAFSDLSLFFLSAFSHQKIATFNRAKLALWKN